MQLPQKVSCAGLMGVTKITVNTQVESVSANGEQLLFQAYMIFQFL